MNTWKALITFFFCCLVLQAFAKRDTIPLLKVSVYRPKGFDKNLIIPYSDSLRINFDGGFKNDFVQIKVGKDRFTMDSLISDPLFGFAESIRILKPRGRQRLFIFLNGQASGSLILKKKYSEVHVNYFRPKNELRWTYHVFQFVYL